MQEAGQEVHSAQIEWQGRIVTRSDRLSVLDAHYLKHVIKRGEWPQGTTLEEYTESIRAVVQDPNSGIMASWLRGRWRLNFMANVPEMRPHWGTDWIVVEYDVAEAGGIQHTELGMIWITSLKTRGAEGYDGYVH